MNRHVEAERLGGFEIDYQLELGRRVHPKVGRLCTFENAIDIFRRFAVLVGHVRSPCRKAAMSTCASGSLSAGPISTPIRRTMSGCCARTASGHAIAELAIALVKLRRGITFPKA
jgi:hypothetical protein